MKRRTLATLLLAGIGLPGSAGAVPQDPREGDDLIVLETNLGHLVLALYPDVAPRHVEQLVALTRCGVYNGTFFAYADPGFVVQLSSASDRRNPMTPEQAAAIRKLPLEANARHVRRSLTMSRDENDPNSAETSFSILISDAPHLDGQYTVFGYVKHGWEVVREMDRIARTEKTFPRMEVIRADVVPVASLNLKLLRFPVEENRPKGRKPHWATFGNPWNPTPPSGHLNTSSDAGDPVTVVMLGLVLLCGLAVFLLSRRSSKWLASLGLMTAVLAFYILFRALGPAAPFNPGLATVLFIGQFVALFLMTQFDPPLRPEIETPEPAGPRS